MNEQPLQDVYVRLLGECFERLDSAADFLHQLESRPYVPLLEAAILQVRKSLELIALAAIAPDKPQYQALRASAEKDPDFTKDYHAAKIFGALERINPDFFPKPLLPPEKRANGSWHFGDRKADVLGKKQFGRAYDRLGKHLHAHNPWGPSKQMEQIASDLPRIIARTRALIALHARVIRTDSFQGVWIVQADSSAPRVITGAASGPFMVASSHGSNPDRSRHR